MYDDLAAENARYQIEVRNRAAKIMREEGLPMFNALDKAQKQIASERQAATRQRNAIGELFARPFRRSE